MFERYVFVKLVESWSSPEGCALVIEESRKVLPSIPQVRASYAGLPAAEDAAKGWDLCLRLRFDSLEDIEAYRVHPDHQRFLTEFLGPKVEAKRVWNFRMEEFPAA